MISKSLLKMYFIFLLFSFSLLKAQDQCVPAGSPVSGNQVQSIRLDESGGSMFGIPVHDQGDLNICYASAASQIAMAYHQQKYNTPYRHCPIAMAADSIRYLPRAKTGHLNSDGTRNGKLTPLDYGKVCDVISASNQYGYCGDCSALYSAFTREEAQNYFHSMYSVFERYRNRGVTRLYQALEEQYIAFMLTSNVRRDPNYFNPDRCSNANQLPEVPLPTLDVVRRMMSTTTPGTFFQALVSQSCTPRNPAPRSGSSLDAPRCTPQYGVTRDALRSKLRGHFSSSRDMPLGIDYCMNMFEPGAQDTEFTRQDGKAIFSENPNNSDRAHVYKKLLDSRVLAPLVTFISELESSPRILSSASTPQEIAERASGQKILNYAKEVKTCLELIKNKIAANDRQYLALITSSSQPHGFVGDGENVGAHANVLNSILEQGSVTIPELNTCKDRVLTARGESLPSDVLSAELTDVVLVGKQNSSGKSMDEIVKRDWNRITNCGAHSSVLIGQRCSGGKIQYLLKNSVGLGCDQYQNNALTCDTNSAGAPTGSVWVDENMLLGSVWRTNTIPAP